MTPDILRHAEQRVLESGLDATLVIDADVHHLDVIPHLAPYLDQPWRRVVESAPGPGLKQANIGNRFVASRIKRTFSRRGDRWPTLKDGSTPPRQILRLVEELARIGVDYSVVFPNDLLSLGLHPQGDFEVAVATAYARWMTEQVLAHEPRVWSMLYLPFCDPGASRRLVEEFGDKPGVVGFLVTGNRDERVHHSRWMPVYAALEERSLALGFHSTGYWASRPFNMFDTFMTAHALSFPIYNAIHLVNLVLSGIPERFPGLRFIFFEAGAAVVPMLMARLDSVFLMRPAEAPLLKRRPSDYMREFFYTIQPVEHPDRPGQLEAIVDAIGRSQILFATDYPHWDCDMPASILDLAFLSPEDRKDIFYRNAVRAFDLKAEQLSLSDWKQRARARAVDG